MTTHGSTGWSACALAGAGVGTELARIRADFAEARLKAGRPSDMALFMDFHAGGRVTLYFSPMTATYSNDLLQRAHTFASARPKKADVLLLEPDPDNAEETEQADVAWAMLD
jgi:hypothetical protein